MASLRRFNIGSISKKLNQINARISVANNVVFPCLMMRSSYRFKKRFVKILPNGDIQGGFTRMITSLVDFSFVRSLTAHRYSMKSPPPYDPPSLFLLELFRYIDQYPNMDRFLKDLRDKDRGRAYRAYAGIHMNHIPTKGTFSNFKIRLGERLYNEIFHVLVDIFHQLEMITFNIIAHDGTLFPTRARYKGCTCFSGQCQRIEASDVIARVKKQVLYRLNNLAKVDLEKAFKIKIDCPCNTLPEKIKRPRFEALVMKIGVMDGSVSENQKNTAILFGVKEQLDKQGLCLEIIRSNILEVAPDLDRITLRCPKIPKDIDARIGVRNDPKNPSRKQKIFGYNLVLSTSVELDLKLELPVAAVNMAGNGLEGEKIITLGQQIRARHDCRPKIDIADAKYDNTDNYTFLRANGSIPIIDYNVRRENLTVKALRERGYDRNGWPYAPCDMPTRPNGYDAVRQRLTFCCHKQCLDLKVTGIRNLDKAYDISSCKHLDKTCGYTTHSFVKKLPRLLNEIPRGTRRYNAIKRCRSASERSNSTIKETLNILEKPIVYKKQRADILAQIAAIALLLYRAFAFVVKISVLFMKYRETKDPAIAKRLQPFEVPKSIRTIIQRE
ncbi:MAG: hypothetical protein RQ739_16970 [Desulfotignum sp.]|nr:hypothetical protein [Desulfotignum sp.]